jgi:hypothetical protein
LGDEGDDRAQEAEEHRSDQAPGQLHKASVHGRDFGAHGLEFAFHLASEGSKFLAHLLESLIGSTVKVVEPLVGSRFPCHDCHVARLQSSMQRVVRET